MPATASDVAPAPALPPALRAALAGGCALGVFFVLTTVTGDLIRVTTGHDNLMGVLPMFNLRGEGNLPTWYHASLLLSCAALAAWIARSATVERTRWWVLAAALFFLSADEASSMHELFLNAPLRDALGATGVFYFAWVIPYGVAAIVFTAAYVPFARALPRWCRVRVVWAYALYLAGALGEEMLQGWLYTRSGADAMYFTVWTLGETLETAGLLLFAYALLALAGSSTRRPAGSTLAAPFGA